MHKYNLEKWQHKHEFAFENKQAEKRTKIVFLFTVVTMVVEIVAGTLYGSMALLADGWHMGTHTAAFLITLFAYRYAREHAEDEQYSFGTGKVNVLGGFASAVALAAVALFMIIESIDRFAHPVEIGFNESIFVAIIGLTVNFISALLLKDDHHHHHHGHDHHHEEEHHLHEHKHEEHDHDHDDHDEHEHEEEHHEDHNLRAAYMHVIADALTSLMAIFALLAGKYLSWFWLDPFMGIVGGLVIIRWAYGLLQQTSPILLDASIETPLKKKIIQKIEKDKDNLVADIHIWKIGTEDYAAIISIVTHFPQEIEHYKNLIHDFHLSHVTFEVNVCKEKPCMVS